MSWSRTASLDPPSSSDRLPISTEKEVTGLVFVGELVEETRDPLLRRILAGEDGQQPLLDAAQSA